ncbi:ATP-binding cassette domain-containing protein, partial [Brevibacterium paucivorans]|uniref:ATP-binding cassette domain-containing protein n=1 Tax=Brevibacterium paucivorans TaxID=170994 RepID=UPI003570C1C3
ADNISAGERQLITIARAFASEPTILILDEATSNVDTRTEVLVQEAMNRLQAGRTSFVIAHRLSTIRNADVIVVMNKGRIASADERVEERVDGNCQEQDRQVGDGSVEHAHCLQLGSAQTLLGALEEGDALPQEPSTGA